MTITREEIFRLATERETLYKPMWEAMKEDWSCISASANWRKNLMPKYLKGFPTNYVPKVPPIAKKALELFRTTVMVGEVPEIKVPLPKGMKATKDTLAKRKAMEDFDQAWAYQVATRPGINPFVDILNKSGGLGMGAISAVFDWEAWPEKPDGTNEEELREYKEKREGCFPWKVTIQHPSGYMPDPWNEPPEDIVIKDKVSARLAKKLYPHLLIEPSETQLERIIYISEDSYAVYVKGQAAFTEGEEGVVPNPMGLLWMETVWSGIGELNEDNDFEFLGQGIIRNARDIITLLVKAINRAEMVADITAFTPRHIKGQTIEEAREFGATLEFGPDAKWETPSTVSADPLKMTPLDPNSLWTNEQMIMWLRIVFGQDILSGASTTDTATTLMKNISLAEAPFKPIRINAEQGWANILRKVHCFIKHELDEDGMSLYSASGGIVSLRTDQIIEECPIEVNYRPPTDEERAFNTAGDGQLLDRHMISPEEFKRRQGIEDSEEEQQKILEGLLMYHELVVGASAQVIANQINPVPPPTGVIPETPQMGISQNGAQPDQRMPSSNQQVAANQAEKMMNVPLRTQQ